MFDIIPFLSYVFVMTFTPGPNNIMSMANANKFGFKSTIKFMLGIATGFAIIMLLSSYFNLLLFNLLPKVKGVMGILGAAYMIYLAIKIVKSDDQTSKSEDEGDGPKKNSNISSYFIGLTMQFVNPKGLIFGITVASNFIIPYYKSHGVLLLFSILLAVIALASTTSWALLGSIFQRFLSRYRKQFNIVMGLLLVYSAISISGLI